MAFYLFIALNAALFLRPQELIPGLEWANFYQWTIIACILTSGLAMLRQLSPDVLTERPINACVVGLLIAVRIVLGWSIAVEIEGCWPWQVAARRKTEVSDQ